ncbi:TPA: endonuclease/exonuclease/phosphatase family protein [Bacillus cereus]|uniref:endonuclease/exonuclease/phosphatase family protein n=1 Tax=Bacillus cereus TaxID=1396 RepID=UPI0030193427
MNCLFWNVNNCKLNNHIVDIVIENNINILALAEYEDDKDELKRSFIAKGYNIFELENLGTRVIVFTTIQPGSIERIIDKKHYTLFRVNYAGAGKVMFGFVHIFSKMMKDENDYYTKMGKMVEVIERKELENGSDYTIIAGDFNMNPFEKGMLAGGALHSFPTILEAHKKKRKLDDEEYKMFYNPMWKFLGSSDLPGTYFTTPTHTYGLYWNLFDQVIYRPCLIDTVENVQIMTKIGDTNLINDTFKIMVSDHLPIYFELKEM